MMSFSNIVNVTLTFPQAKCRAVIALANVVFIQHAILQIQHA